MIRLALPASFAIVVCFWNAWFVISKVITGILVGLIFI